LTFTFEWEHAEIERGSKEELESQRQYQKSVARGVGLHLTENQGNGEGRKAVRIVEFLNLVENARDI
jgi:hypothetical protein